MNRDSIAMGWITEGSQFESLPGRFRKAFLPTAFRVALGLTQPHLKRSSMGLSHG